ncbi:hypothetical protein Tco_1428233 [Tanacetum coccineum]
MERLTRLPLPLVLGVNDFTEASGSKPRSNTKKNRILPAKKENKKEVEVHLRTNKELCVVNILNSINATPTVRTVLKKGKLSNNSLNKTKQIWKPKGKLSDNSLYKTKQVWKLRGKNICRYWLSMETQERNSNFGNLICGSQWRHHRKEICLKRNVPRMYRSCCWYRELRHAQIHLTGNRSKLMNCVEKFLG